MWNCNMQVILTDGDTSTLTNMKENMELNNLCIEQEDSDVLKECKNKVSYFPCIIQSNVRRSFLSYIILRETVELDGSC